MQIVERDFFVQDKRTRAESFSQLFGAARRFHRHRASLDTYAELVGAVADALWEFTNKRRISAYLSYSEAKRLFFQSACKVRVAQMQDIASNEMRDIGGFIVLHGELKALWCDVPGNGAALVRYAMSLGATKLQCFDGYLPGLYSQFGFVIVKREPNWVHGEPDLVYMEIK